MIAPARPNPCTILYRRIRRAIDESNEPRVRVAIRHWREIDVLSRHWDVVTGERSGKRYRARLYWEVPGTVAHVVQDGDFAWVLFDVVEE